MGLGISWDRLAGNVSLNGALGIISSVGTGFYENRKYIKKELNGKPYGSTNFYSTAGLRAVFENARKICGSAPLGCNVMMASNEYARIVRDACEAGANAIISGAGLPLSLPDLVKDFKDVAVIPIISSAKALRVICKRWSQLYGRLPDAVIVEGPESGGHLGFSYEQCIDPAYQLHKVLPEVAIEAKKWGDFPLIAAGGVWDHEDIKHMISCGASGAQMGTRFIGTFECDAADGFKQVLLDAKKEDIELIKSPVGYPARGIRSNLHKMIDEGTAPKINCIANCVAPCERGVGARKVGFCIAERLHDSYMGKKESGLFFSGSNGWKLSRLLPVKELIHRLFTGDDPWKDEWIEANSCEISSPAAYANA